MFSKISSQGPSTDERLTHHSLHQTLRRNDDLSEGSFSSLLMEFLINSVETSSDIPSCILPHSQIINEFNRSNCDASSQSSGVNDQDINMIQENTKQQFYEDRIDLSAISAELISSISREMEENDTQIICKSPTCKKIKVENENTPEGSIHGDQHNSDAPRTQSGDPSVSKTHLRALTQEKPQWNQEDQSRLSKITSLGFTAGTASSRFSKPELIKATDFNNFSCSSTPLPSSSPTEGSFLSFLVSSLQEQPESKKSMPVYHCDVQSPPTVSLEFNSLPCNQTRLSPSPSASPSIDTPASATNLAVQNALHSSLCSGSNGSSQSLPSRQHSSNFNVDASHSTSSSGSTPFGQLSIPNISQIFSLTNSNTPFANPITIALLLQLLGLPKNACTLGSSVFTEICSALAAGDVKPIEMLLTNLVSSVTQNQPSIGSKSLEKAMHADDYCSGLTATQRLITQMIESPTSTFLKRLPQPTLRGNITVQKVRSGFLIKVEMKLFFLGVCGFQGVFFNARQNVFIAHWYTKYLSLS